MSTVKLARKLGLVERTHVNKSKQSECSVQEYQYLLVLDFEATCWEKTNNSHFVRPEIIEFSVVLYKIASNEIVEQFQQYVMPTENYKLSEFCINLTGITQEQVDNGIPIGTCLMLFSQWIKEQEQLHKIVLYKNSSIKGNCIFVTWSDWDLGNCLVRECKRKRIKRADYFKNWTDLRALYMEFYHRRPRGLHGALSEVGLNFEGQEHCGLHDARNTAFLTGRMIQSGALIRITKELHM